LTFNGLHGVVSQKIELVITTCVQSLESYIIIKFVGKHDVRNKVKSITEVGDIKG
jgi:hypothetical protein